jgi:hypothetical protein
VLRRRRRLASGDGEAAYAEVLDTAIDLGMPVHGATPRTTLAQVRASTAADPQVAGAIDRIQRAVEWQRYGPTEAVAARRGALAADVQLVRRASADRAGVGRRVAAVLVPRSLLPRWWAAPGPDVARAGPVAWERTGSPRR